MKHEQSAGVIVFRIETGKPLYLLLHYPRSDKAKEDYWDLPKGHIEKGETKEAAARREAREETGLSNLAFIAGFREEIRYCFDREGERVEKTVAFFLAETKQKNILLSAEHVGFAWLEYESARGRLTFQTARSALKKARETIESNRSGRSFTS